MKKLKFKWSNFGKTSPEEVEQIRNKISALGASVLGITYVSTNASYTLIVSVFFAIGVFLLGGFNYEEN